MPVILARFLQRINPIEQWNINNRNYDLKAEIRKAIFNNPKFSRFISYGSYETPAAGYDGWYKVPLFGCLAFKPTDNETLNFRW